ncbi:MAG: hypothetical protein Q7V57_16770 [Actinomycetota bacterium]|nr:hypothetical protein [Actinomycetota bacterium]
MLALSLGMVTSCTGGGSDTVDRWQASLARQLVDGAGIGAQREALALIDESGKGGSTYVALQVAHTLALIGEADVAKTVVEKWLKPGIPRLLASGGFPPEYVALELLGADQSLHVLTTGQRQEIARSLTSRWNSDTSNAPGSIDNIVSWAVDQQVARLLAPDATVQAAVDSWTARHPVTCTAGEIEATTAYPVAMLIGRASGCDATTIRARLADWLSRLQTIDDSSGWYADSCALVEVLSIAAAADDTAVDRPAVELLVLRAAREFSLTGSADPDVCSSVLSRAAAQLGLTISLDPAVVRLLTLAGEAGAFPRFVELSTGQVAALATVLDVEAPDAAQLAARYAAVDRPTPALLSFAAGQTPAAAGTLGPLDYYLLAADHPQWACAQRQTARPEAGVDPDTKGLVALANRLVAKACGTSDPEAATAIADARQRLGANNTDRSPLAVMTDVSALCELDGSQQARNTGKTAARGFLDQVKPMLRDPAFDTFSINDTVAIARLADLVATACA